MRSGFALGLILALAALPAAPLKGEEPVSQEIAFWNDDSGKKVTSVAFSVSGALLAAGRENGRVTVRSWLDKKQLLPPSGKHAAPLRALAFSRDESTLVSGDEAGKFALWAVYAGKLAAEGTIEGLRDAAFSPDGNTGLAALASGGLQSFDPAGGIVRKKFPGPASPALRLLVFPDGQHYLTGHEDGSVSYWSAILEKVARTDAGSGSPVVALGIIPPEGKYYVALTQDGLLRFRDTAKGEARKDCSLPGGGERQAVLPGGMKFVLFFGPDGNVDLVRLPSCEPALSFQLGTGLSALAVSADDKLFLAGFTDGRVSLVRNPLFFRQYHKAVEDARKFLREGKPELAINKFSEAAGIYPEEEAREGLKAAREAQLKRYQEMQERTLKLQRGSK